MVAKETSGIRLLRTIHWVLTFAAVSASSGLSLHPAKDRLRTHTFLVEPLTAGTPTLDST
jgi:hypothetical protein